MSEYHDHASHPAFGKAVTYGLSLLKEPLARGKGIVSFKEGKGVLGIEAASPAGREFIKLLFKSSGYDGKSGQGLSLNTVLGDVIELAPLEGHDVEYSQGRGKNAGVKYHHIHPKLSPQEN